MFVKDINDFCRERLYPKEKFLWKNWVEYLPNDRRSLYSVCMKHLSIPEGSNPKEIWGRVIVPSFRDIPEHEVQFEQQNQEHLPEYEIFIRICTHITYCRRIY